MKQSKIWAILLALTLVAAACGGGDTEATEEDDTGTTAGESDGEGDGDGEGEGGELVTDFGVTDEVIRIGYNADLSGIFAPTVIQIIDATEVYWDFVNENGGIAGRDVEPVIIDNAYDVPRHLENHEIFVGDGAESVVMLGQSTGSPHTAATVDSLAENNIAAIPLTWYSGWADPVIGANVFEVQITYCLEAMNGISFMSERYGDKVALMSFPGEYGQDVMAGAKYAIEQLGLEIVYDGEAAVVPGSDQTPVITEIVRSGADFVYASINPTTLQEIMGGAVQQGFTGMWSGASPTFNFQLIGSDLGETLEQYYIHSAYTTLWGLSEGPGMEEVVTQMREKRPEAPVSDLYLLGWINGMIVKQMLEQAEANGDMTRAGVLQAGKEITVDLGGLAPNQTWAGEPNDYIVRESYMYAIDRSKFTAGATVSDENAGTGFTLLEGPFASELAAEYDFQGACFVTE